MINGASRLLEQKNIYISDKSITGKIAFLFPGHGSQYVNMLYDLYKQEKVVREVFCKADHIFMRLTGDKLTEQIFTENEAKEVIEKNMQKAEIMQTSIYTANYAMYQLITSYGFEADYLIGHSLGEFSALAAGGVFSFEDGLEIVYLRAHTLNRLEPDKRGAMISIATAVDHPKYIRLIRGLQEDGYMDVTQSIHNTDHQVILSAEKATVQEIDKRCKQASIKSQILKTSHGFHSELLKEESIEFYKKLLRFKYKVPKTNIYSTIGQRLYSFDERDYDTRTFAEFLSKQFITPFSFKNNIRELHDIHEVRSFIEVGANKIISTLTKDILHEDEVFIVNSNEKKKNDNLAFQICLAKCYSNNIKNGKVASETENDNELADNADELNDIFMKIITEKTGYPQSVMSGDLEFEADLGIDSVRQADIISEFLSCIKFDFDSLEEEKQMKILQEKTIKGLIKEIYKLRINKESYNMEKEADKMNQLAGTGREELEQIVKESIAEKTGYPVSILEQDQDLEADLGIDSVKQADILGDIFEKLDFKKEEEPEKEENKPLSTINEIVDELMSGVPAGHQEESADVIAVKENGEAAAESCGETLAIPDLAQVESRIKEIISEKTGYPKEVLENNLDFEADLGIDSVKQADICAVVFNEYGLNQEQAKEKIGGEAIDNINTMLNAIFQLKAEIPMQQSESLNNEKMAEAVDFNQKIKDYRPEEEQGRYISISKEVKYKEYLKKIIFLNGKKVIIVEDGIDGSYTQRIVNKLRDENAEVVVISKGKFKYENVNVITTSFRDMEQYSDNLKKAHEQLGEVDGIINLNTLCREIDFLALPPQEWENAVNEVFQVTMCSVKEIYSDLAKDSERFSIAAGNMGGVFGVEDFNGNNILVGLNAGFSKALKKELVRLHCKILDFNEFEDREFVAERLIEEIKAVDEIEEIAYINGKRKAIIIVPEEIKNVEQKSACYLNEEDVIVFGGGGRGIMSEFANALIEVYNPNIVLTGRTKLPNGDESWILMSENEFEAYKSEFIAAEKKACPDTIVVEILEKYEKLAHARQLYESISKLKNKSNKVYYYVCDVSSHEDVQKLYHQIKERFGHIDGIINGAGLPSIGKVNKKSLAYASDVVITKCMGFYNLYTIFQNEPLKFFNSVGSISGRMGMDGQVDYCAGSDIISKMSAVVNKVSKKIRAFTMDWSAWKDIGMATFPTVQKIQNERGLKYIEVKEGGKHFLKEITYGGNSHEIMIFGPLGDDKRDESQIRYIDWSSKQLRNILDENGHIINKTKYPYIDSVISYDERSLEVEKVLDINEDVHLRDHVVKGNYVFAGVSHLELDTEMVALLMELSENDWMPGGVETAYFEQFVKYFPQNPLKLKCRLEIVEQNEEIMKFHCEIRSDFCNSHGEVLIKDRLHSRAELFGYPAFKQKPARLDQSDIRKRYKGGKQLNLKKFYEATKDVIYFGELFQKLDGVSYIDRDIYIGCVSVVDDSKLFKNLNTANTIMSPITLDCIGRVLLVGIFHDYGLSTVPVKLSEIDIVRYLKKDEKLYTEAFIEERNGEELNCLLNIYDDDGYMVVRMRVDLHVIGKLEEHDLSI